MSETHQNTIRRRRASKESLEVARAISEEVIPTAEPIETPIELEEAPAQAELIEEPPKATSRVSKNTQESIPTIDVATAKRPIKTVRVKATKTIRGVVGNFRYNIVAGEVYSLPENVASWLSERGRVI